MANEKFEYDPEGILSLSAKIAQCRGRMGEIILALKKDVQELDEEWNSDASKAFVEKYSELCVLVDNVVESIGNLETSLSAIAQNIINEG